jgi:UPF0755 protein
VKKAIIVLIAFLITAGALFAAGLAAWNYMYDRKNSSTINGAAQYFILKADCSIEIGGDELRSKSIITSKEALLHYASLYNLEVPFKKGNYLIKPGTDIKDLLLKLQSGKSDFAIVTIPEGYSLYQIGKVLEENNLIKKDELLKTKLSDFDTDGLLQQKDNVIYPLEGYMFPATYYIPVNTDKNQVIGFMYGKFLKVFSDSDRQRAKELGLSVNDIITVASLIEKEAANDQERSWIAGVIYNRLKAGMPLQIDAAVIYANTLGEKTLNPVTYTALKKDSKYNTYLYKGLPPGPIASPGKPSIEAALYPEKNDYLYYVLGPNGHVFSKTFEEQKANEKKYLK